MKVANCPRVEVPSDPSDVAGWLEALVRAEECAIGVYKRMHEEFKGREPRVSLLAAQLMEEEAEHREVFRRLLSLLKSSREE